ncbi:MAG: hypothetical protein U0792_25110 [Gemmataceae bacterium]
MTEEEWLSGQFPDSLLKYIDRCENPAKGKVRTRKCRLFRCAAFRSVWTQIPDDLLRDAVVKAEEFADGACQRKELLLMRTEVSQTAHWLKSPFVEGCYNLLNPTAHRRVLDYFPYGATSNLCPLIRDIFGNPFRPVTFAPEWRSDTAVSLAKHIYEARDFAQMPILADALQDAGCDNAEVLNHCRDANQVHVRGCWVVDRVLGKS